MLRNIQPWRAVVVLALVAWATSAGAQAPDLQQVARNLVSSARVASGEKVLITGSVRDVALLEDVAVETMKAGGQPLVVLQSEELGRRSFDEVPESFDTLRPTLWLAVADMIDVQISVDVGESEAPLAHVAQARLTTRAQAFEPVNEVFYRRSIRLVSLGNGMYPTAALSQRLGIAKNDLGAVFWRAAGVPSDVLREKGAALRERLAKAATLTLTHPNGTRLTFAVDASRGFISDGSITPEKVKQGGAAVQTWLPAGELILPAAAGTASGTVVVDRLMWRGKEITGLKLAYDAGRLTSMTASTNVEGLRAAYDGAGGAKDRFGYVDIGVNPETKLPLGRGMVVWTVPGSLTVGLGDNRGFGGTNASEFALATQIPGASLLADGVAIVENGALK